MDIYKTALKIAINKLVDAISDKECEACPCEKYYLADYQDYVCDINLNFRRDIRACKEQQKQAFYKDIMAEAEQIINEIPLLVELVL